MSDDERYIVKHRDGRYMCHDGQWHPPFGGAIPDRVRVFTHGICDFAAPYERARRCANDNYPAGRVVRLVWKSKATGAEERSNCESCSKPADTTDFEGTPFCAKCALSITAKERDEAWAKGAALVRLLRELYVAVHTGEWNRNRQELQAAIDDAIVDLESAVTR